MCMCTYCNIYIHTLINVYVYMFAHMHIYLHRFENNTCVDFWNHHPPLFPWLLVYFFDGANEDLLKFCKQKRHGLHVKVETRGSKDVDHDGPFCGCWKIVQVAYARLARFYHWFCTCKLETLCLHLLSNFNPIPLIQQSMKGSESVFSSLVSTIVSAGGVL